LPGQYPVQRDAVPAGHARSLHALLAAVHRAASGALPAARRLGDAPVDEDFLEDQVGDAVIGVQRDPLEPGDDPLLDPFVAAVLDRGGRAGTVGD
jgi:hypothetical protein